MDLFTGNLLGRMARSPGAGVLFPISTESLEAIMQGLDPNSDDVILAVGGCGDQAFALIEKAGRVVVSEVNQSQLDLIRKRKEALEAEDYEKFFVATGSDYEFFNSLGRVKYFSDRARIDAISRNLPNLVIGRAKSIEEHVGLDTFNKIYASDAISPRHSDIPVRNHLISVLMGLRKQGLLYMANGHEIEGVTRISDLGIQFERELTAKARAAESLYKPVVYRKI